MKILVTGAAGFIGYHLVKKLLDRGDIVVGIDNINDYYDVNLKYDRLNETGISKQETKHWYTKIRSSVYSEYSFVRMNLEDDKQLNQLFEYEKFEIVINLAAQAGVRYSILNPHSYIQSNIVGFMNILEACRYNPVKHLIYASSSSVYGVNAKKPFSEEDKVDHPVSLYAATKKSNELMAHTYSHLYRIPTTGLRFFTVYGPWGRPDMAPILFANAISKNEPIKVFNNGEMQRDFTYIDDIIDGIVNLLDKPPINTIPEANIEDNSFSSIVVTRGQIYSIYNIGNGTPISLMEFIENIENSLSKKAEKIMMPMQDGDVKETWADIGKLSKNTEYKPKIDIHEGINYFIEWYKDYYKNK